MTEIFFASDHHFSHRNIIDFCNRPFTDIDEMNNALIQNHNLKVSRNDTVYFLGDFAFTKDVEYIISIIQQLNGQKHFICGNHDRIMLNDSIKQEFVSFTEAPVKEIKIGKTNLTLSHYAMLVWNKSHYGALNLFGYSHGTKTCFENKQQLDVGVDCWGFSPVSLDEIFHKLKTLPDREIDRIY